MSTADFVTVLRLTGRANKLIQRNRSGEVAKQAGPPLFNAVGTTVYVPDCEAMAALLGQVSDDPTATLVPSGYFPQTEPDDNEPLAVGPEFNVSSKKFLAEHLGVDRDDGDRLIGWHCIDGQRHIARVKPNMLPTSWMLFDRDEVKGMPERLAEMDDDEWLEAMSSMVPGRKEISMVKVPSSTGRVLVDGEPMSAAGRHYYVPISDGEDLERFGATLLQRSFVAGYGFMRPLHSKDNPEEIVGHRQWSIFDPTTFSRERLVYEGAPTVKGRGVTLTPSEIEVI